MSAQSRPTRQDRVALAQHLFEQYYAQCFWHMPPGLRVGPANIPTIAKGLRTYGGHSGFLAAASLCRSAKSKPRSSR